MWQIAIQVFAALPALVGFWWGLSLPVVGLVALVLSLVPLVIARISTGGGGCAIYPLMIVSVWALFPVLGFVAAPYMRAIRDEDAFFEVGAIAVASYLCFAMASMILALSYRFKHAEDRHSVSLGERITVSLFALAPLVLFVGILIFAAGKWLVDTAGRL